MKPDGKPCEDSSSSEQELLQEGVAFSLGYRILPEPDLEDPDVCEIHRFVLRRVKRFERPIDAETWQNQVEELRKKLLSEVYLKGHPVGLLDLEPVVRWIACIETSGGYRIHKLLYEGYPGMWIPALLYEPENLSEPVPAVLNVNGHEPGGKAIGYKQARCINLAKRGMLALSTEFIGMGELSMNLPHSRIAHMDLCGKAGIAIFYLAMKRALDLLLSHRYCDPERTAMTGLSGGGWQTVVLGALDERIKVNVPVAGYSPIWQRPSCRADVGDLEQVPTDLGATADYDLLTAMFAPRPTLLIYNRYDDCCFRSDRTRSSVFEPAKAVYELLGCPDNIEFYENIDPGTHNYEADNRSRFYRFLNKHFNLDSPEFDLPFEEELKSETLLNVGIPHDNASLLTLARSEARDLPHPDFLPSTKAKREQREEARRNRLKTIIRYRSFTVREEIVKESEAATQVALHMDDEWTIPATLIRASKGSPIRVIVADGGRLSVVQLVEEYLSKGESVVVADVFGAGESSYIYEYQMLVDSVGERALGILAGQITATARWAASIDGKKKSKVTAVGPTTSFGALCGAASAPDVIDSLNIESIHSSLHLLIDTPVEHENGMPHFCFGLLKEFDVWDILSLIEEIQVEMRGRDPVHPIIPYCRESR